MDPVLASLFEFETTEAADLGGGADVDDDAALGLVDESGADVTDDSSTARSDETDDTDASDWFNTPEFHAAVDERAAHVASQSQQQFASQLANALGVNPDQPQAPPVPDPFADNYAEQVAQRDQWLIDQVSSRFQKMVEPMQAAQTDRVIEQAVTGAVSAFPDANLVGDDVNRAGSAFFLEAQGDVAQAARMGAQWLADRDKKVGEAAVAAHVERLKTLDGAERDINNGSEGSETLGEPADEIEAAMRYAARRKLGA